MIVVDASAILELLLRTPAGLMIEERLASEDEDWHAPHLVDLEIAQALRRYLLAGEIEAKRGREALLDLADLPLHRYPHVEFLDRVWDMRANLTAYDAAYIALAEALDCTLITRDAKLAGSVGHSARIELA